jgi:hypothetical protein
VRGYIVTVKINQNNIYRCFNSNSYGIGSGSG